VKEIRSSFQKAWDDHVNQYSAGMGVGVAAVIGVGALALSVPLLPAIGAALLGGAIVGGALWGFGHLID
jgi:hypothetical protein